jgi:hypothetical protein
MDTNKLYQGYFYLFRPKKSRNLCVASYYSLYPC